MKGTLVFCDHCTVDAGQHAFGCPSGKGVLKTGLFPEATRKVVAETIKAMAASTRPSLFEVCSRLDSQ